MIFKKTAWVSICIILHDTINRISVSPTQVSFQPTDSLNNFAKYFVVVKSSQIMADYPSNTPSYLFYLDGDKDGPEATEPDSVWYFYTEDTNNNDEPPHVANVSTITGGPLVSLLSTKTLTWKGSKGSRPRMI